MKRWRRLAIVLSAALVVAGCSPDDEQPAAGPAHDGVTDEPCPDAVNPDNGCIYLGVLSDLSEGPFAALAQPLTRGQRDFFRRVNEQGGIGGYDVDITTYTRDTRYDPQPHSAAYREIEPSILLLAQTLGTPPTQGILRDMDDDDIVGVPMSWWSGWDFPDETRGLILSSGYSYCMESMIALDWFSEEYGQPSSVIAVGYPGDYGGDSAAGAELWAQANGAEFLGFVETAPNPVVGSQDRAIGRIVRSGADVVIVATGPTETAEIVGGAAADDFTGTFFGALPTWSPGLMATSSAPALQEQYYHVIPWENLVEGDSDAHLAMREALGDGLLDTNDGYGAGWVMSYPILAVLEAAAAAGDVSRAGVRAAVETLTVDYEGALPDRTFGVDPNDFVLREAVIAAPDPDSEWNESTVATGVTGPTAQAHDYTGPCIAS